jgi:hypothetical protein
VTGITVVGVRGHFVALEAHVGRGLPSLTLTGLPGAGVCRTPACWRASLCTFTNTGNQFVLFHDDPLDGFGLSAEDSAVLHAIMAVGSRERLEFLGG